MGVAIKYVGPGVEVLGKIVQLLSQRSIENSPTFHKLDENRVYFTGTLDVKYATSIKATMRAPLTNLPHGKFQCFYL